MGVKFRDIVSPESIKFEQLENKIVALDAANIIYQFLSSIRQVDGTPLMDQNGNITSHFQWYTLQNILSYREGNQTHLHL